MAFGIVTSNTVTGTPVTLLCELCPQPSGMSATTLSETEIKFFGENATLLQYIECISAATEPWLEVTGFTGCTLVTGLTPCTDYCWRLINECAPPPNPATTGTTLTASTCLPCPPPTGMSATTLSETEIQFFGSPATILQYREDGAMMWIDVTGFTGSEIVTGLTPCQEYEWRLINDCPSTTLLTVTSMTESAATDCPCDLPFDLSAITISHTEIQFFATSANTLEYCVDMVCELITGITFPYSVTGLSACTLYEWRAGNDCGGGNIGWTDGMPISTLFSEAILTATCCTSCTITPVVNIVGNDFIISSTTGGNFFTNYYLGVNFEIPQNLFFNSIFYNFNQITGETTPNDVITNFCNGTLDLIPIWATAQNDPPGIAGLLGNPTFQIYILLEIIERDTNCRFLQFWWNDVAIFAPASSTTVTLCEVGTCMCVGVDETNVGSPINLTTITANGMPYTANTPTCFNCDVTELTPPYGLGSYALGAGPINAVTNYNVSSFTYNITNITLHQEAVDLINGAITNCDILILTFTPSIAGGGFPIIMWDTTGFETLTATTNSIDITINTNVYRECFRWVDNINIAGNEPLSMLSGSISRNFYTFLNLDGLSGALSLSIDCFNYDTPQLTFNLEQTYLDNCSASTDILTFIQDENHDYCTLSALTCESLQAENDLEIITHPDGETIGLNIIESFACSAATVTLTFPTYDIFTTTWEYDTTFAANNNDVWLDLAGSSSNSAITFNVPFISNTTTPINKFRIRAILNGLSGCSVTLIYSAIIECIDGSLELRGGGSNMCLGYRQAISNLGLEYDNYNWQMENFSGATSEIIWSDGNEVITCAQVCSQEQMDFLQTFRDLGWDCPPESAVTKSVLSVSATVLDVLEDCTITDSTELRGCCGCFEPCADALSGVTPTFSVLQVENNITTISVDIAGDFLFDCAAPGSWNFTGGTPQVGTYTNPDADAHPESIFMSNGTLPQTGVCETVGACGWIYSGDTLNIIGYDGVNIIYEFTGGTAQLCFQTNIESGIPGDTGCTICGCITISVGQIFAPLSLTYQPCEIRTQNEFDAAFNAWLTGFTFIPAAGCLIDMTGFTNPIQPPFTCGDEYSYTTAFSALSCGDVYISDESTFIISAATPLTVTGSTVLITECPTEQELNNIYTAWTATFMYMGGCSAFTDNIGAIPTLPPYVCGSGFTLDFLYSVSGACDIQTFYGQFIVDDSLDLTINIPDEVNLSCATQQEIEIEYANWVSGFSFNGGCDGGTTDNINDIVSDFTGHTYDPEMNFSYTFDYEVSGGCGEFLSSASTFNVSPGVPLNITIPDDIEIDCNFDFVEQFLNIISWLQSFNVNGGCCANQTITAITTPNNIYTTFPTPDSDVIFNLLSNAQCGNSDLFISVQYIVSDDCIAFDEIRTYEIYSADTPLIISTPNNISLPCNTPDVPALYTGWAEGFSVSGGCSVVENSGTIPTLDYTCGEEVDIEFTYNVHCNGQLFSAITRSFFVSGATPLSFTQPNDLIFDCANTTTEQRWNAYIAWLEGIENSCSDGCETTIEIIEFANNMPTVPVSGDFETLVAGQEVFFVSGTCSDFCTAYTFNAIVGCQCDEEIIISVEQVSCPIGVELFVSAREFAANLNTVQSCPTPPTVTQMPSDYIFLNNFISGQSFQYTHYESPIIPTEVVNLFRPSWLRRQVNNFCFPQGINANGSPAYALSTMNTCGDIALANNDQDVILLHGLNQYYNNGTTPVPYLYSGIITGNTGNSCWSTNFSWLTGLTFYSGLGGSADFSIETYIVRIGYNDDYFCPDGCNFLNLWVPKHYPVWGLNDSFDPPIENDNFWHQVDNDWAFFYLNEQNCDNNNITNLSPAIHGWNVDLSNAMVSITHHGELSSLPHYNRINDPIDFYSPGQTIQQRATINLNLFNLLNDSCENQIQLDRLAQLPDNIAFAVSCGGCMEFFMWSGSVENIEFWPPLNTTFLDNLAIVPWSGNTTDTQCFVAEIGHPQGASVINFDTSNVPPYDGATVDYFEYSIDSGATWHPYTSSGTTNTCNIEQICVTLGDPLPIFRVQVTLTNGCVAFAQTEIEAPVCENISIDSVNNFITCLDLNNNIVSGIVSTEYILWANPNVNGGCGIGTNNFDDVVDVNQIIASAETAYNNCDSFSYPYTFIVEDQFGNTGSTMSTFNVNFTGTPTITAPEDIVVGILDCDDTSSILAEYNNWLSGFTTNNTCERDVIITFDPSTPPPIPNSAQTVTFTVSGDCGSDSDTAIFEYVCCNIGDNSATVDSFNMSALTLNLSAITHIEIQYSGATLFETNVDEMDTQLIVYGLQDGVQIFYPCLQYDIIYTYGCGNQIVSDTITTCNVFNYNLLLNNLRIEDGNIVADLLTEELQNLNIFNFTFFGDSTNNTCLIFTYEYSLGGESAVPVTEAQNFNPLINGATVIFNPPNVNVNDITDECSTFEITMFAECVDCGSCDTSSQISSNTISITNNTPVFEEVEEFVTVITAGISLTAVAFPTFEMECGSRYQIFIVDDNGDEHEFTLTSFFGAPIFVLVISPTGDGHILDEVAFCECSTYNIIVRKYCSCDPQPNDPFTEIAIPTLLSVTTPGSSNNTVEYNPLTQEITISSVSNQCNNP